MGVEMMMRAEERIAGEKVVTPSIAPLAYCLHSSFLESHCSCCFNRVYPGNKHRRRVFDFYGLMYVYCSDKCLDADKNVLLQSGELHLSELLESESEDKLWLDKDTVYLRLALRLLFILPPPIPYTASNFLSTILPDAFFPPSDPPRLIGLGLSYLDPNGVPRAHRGAPLIAFARAIRDGQRDRPQHDFSLEASVISLVMTNALQVRCPHTGLVGLAVYDWRVSWINHSCKPNSTFVFHLTNQHADDDDSNSMLIKPYGCKQDDDDSNFMLIKPYGCKQLVESPPFTSSYLVSDRSLSPRVFVRSIKTLEKDEEVTVSYVDLCQPREQRRMELFEKYQFICKCERCNSEPWNYREHVLEEVSHLSQPKSKLFKSKCRQCTAMPPKIMDTFDATNGAIALI